MDGCVAIAGFATSARLSVRAAVATEEMGGEAEEEVRLLFEGEIALRKSMAEVSESVVQGL